MELISKEVLCTLGVSSIHGVGVFAIRDIQKGQELFSFSEKYIPLEGLDDETLKLVLDRNVIYNDTKYVEHPNFDINYTCFMNHSNNPNSDGVVAVVDIEQGEEITEDYRHKDMSDMSKEHFKGLWN